MRLWLTVLGTVVLLAGNGTGWPPGAPTTLAQGTTAGAADDVAVGVIVDTTNPRSMELAREAGFSHAKMIVKWSRLEPKRGRYTFAETDENDLNNVIEAAGREGLKLVLRVDGAPDWAGGKPATVGADAVEAFYAAMASHGKGTVAAYEILNEPNLPFEWGGAPSPSGYAAFLKAACRGVKKGDPAALVIGGGLSPATGGAGGTIEDVDFLRGMYEAGAKGSMDAMAIHNYGGNQEPEREPGDCGICFRRAELYRQVMVEQGDGATPVWSTEFGWLLDPGRDMGQYDWMRVPADKQAEYVVRSFKYARANWPWMTGLLLSNLDASTSPYHTGAHDGMPWFAILNKDHSPRPAWKAFKAWREQDRAAWTAQPRANTSPQPVVAAPALPAADPATVTQASQTREPNPATAPDSATPSPSLTAPATPTAEPTVPPAPSPASNLARLRVAKTDGAGANLRERPRSDGKVVAILLDGTTVEVVGDDTQAGGVTWRNVRTTGSTTDGVSGWVAAQYLAP